MLRRAVQRDQLVEDSDHPQARQRGTDFDGEPFAITLVDHVERPKPPAIVECVRHEVERPITTDEEFTKLTKAASSLGPEIELYLLLAHETGHRCSAVGRLRWDDLNLEKGLVTWRAEHDKVGQEHTVPLSSAAVAGLKAAHRRAARIGDGWVFPSPTDPEKPIRRDLLRDWWQRLEAIAKIDRIRGRGWHSLRRKFATDLKADTPLADLCLLGGWKDNNTVLKCYMKPDEQTMRDALALRAERVAGA